MPFLRNAWYVLGSSTEVTDKPIARTVLNEPIAIFRDADGVARAVQDRCPHRFVPLSMGWVEGNQIRCAYHGVAFDSATGACTDRPTDEGSPFNPKLCIKAYQVHERYGFVWGWMGDAEKADPALIVDIPLLEDDGIHAVYGYLKVQGNQMLIVDNLLDLSHVNFLHKEIAPQGDVATFRQGAEQEGDKVWQRLYRPNIKANDYQRKMMNSTSELCDSCGDISWEAPGILKAYTSAHECGEASDSGALFPSTHLLTPETEYSTHYFWTAGRNRDLDNEALDQHLIAQVTHVFTTQDGPMVEACQRSLGETTDFLAHQPVILKSDAAGIRARRVMQKLIKQEEEARATAAIAAE